MIHDYLSILNGSPLFLGMNDDEILLMLERLNGREHTYQRGEIIIHYGEKAEHIVIIVEGHVDAVQEDFWGNQMLIGRSGPGETIADAFVLAQEEDFPFIAYSYRKTVAIMIEYQLILSTCPMDCGVHARFLGNLLSNLAKKSLILLRKFNHLSNRTLREKLLSFLSAQAAEAKSSRFTIAYNRQGLANYLGVDRSALSSELGRMQRDGLLTFEKNTFELHNKDSV